MKKLKWIGAFVMCYLCLLVLPVQVLAASNERLDVTEEEAYEAMIALKEEYPEGMPWTNDNYYGWNGGIYSGGYGCAGFAFILSDAAFGKLPARMLYDITIDDVRVGDILRVNNNTHSVIVLEVYDDYVVIAEGNYNRSIHWGRRLSAKDVEKADYLMTRYISDPSKPSVSETVTDVFEDVYAEDWYTESIQFVYDNGMMSGSDGTFKPNDNMTRAMMVTTLYRLSGSPKVMYYTATELFDDVESGSWYEDAVNWAYNIGVTTGYTDTNGNPTHFGSNDNVTREQLAVFLYRYAEKHGFDIGVRADIAAYVGCSEVSDYAKEAMQWAVGVGLISGIESNVNGVKIYDLAPKGSATRAQLATILMRFCDYYAV